MRARKILEADVLLSLAVALCTYFVYEYVLAVAVGERPVTLGIMLAAALGMIVVGFQIAIANRFFRARMREMPWIVVTCGKPRWKRWPWVIPLAIYMGDLGLRALQWTTGVESVRLPDFVVALFVLLSAAWVIESFSYRRWLRNLP